jgi:hypothetical protein
MFVFENGIFIEDNCGLVYTIDIYNLKISLRQQKTEKQNNRTTVTKVSFS